MYALKKIGKVFTSTFVGIGPSSYEKEFTKQRSYNGSETLLCAPLFFLLPEVSEKK